MAIKEGGQGNRQTPEQWILDVLHMVRHVGRAATKPPSAEVRLNK